MSLRSLLRSNVPDFFDAKRLARQSRRLLEEEARASATPVYLGESTALCRVLARYKMYIDTRDVGFGAHVLLDGYWESWLTQFLARHVRRGSTFVDVGANHGYYTLLGADLVGEKGKVAAFEPNPRLAELLRRSVELNGFTARTTIFEMAVGATDDDEIFLHVPPREFKNAHVVSQAVVAHFPAAEIFAVKNGRMSSVLGDWPKIDFIKADIEGAEEAAIEGLFPLLERDKPDVVLEFAAVRCRSPREMLQRLERLYGRLRAIDFNANAHPITIDELVDPVSGCERLLFLSRGS